MAGLVNVGTGGSVTGAATGSPTAVEDLRIAKQSAGRAPVIAASGVDLLNVAPVLKIADGLIVGTGFKRDNVTTNPVDMDRVRAFMEVLRRERADHSNQPGT